MTGPLRISPAMQAAIFELIFERFHNSTQLPCWSSALWRQFILPISSLEEEPMLWRELGCSD